MADAIARRLKNTGTARYLSKEEKERALENRPVNAQAYGRAFQQVAAQKMKPVAAKKRTPFRDYLKTGKVQ